MADLVSDEVDELRRRVANRPELNVEDIRLDDRVLHVTFAKHDLIYESAAIPTGLYAPDGRGIGINREVPIIGSGEDRVRLLVLRMDCHNWDGTPPTAELLTPEGEPLPASLWPRGTGAGGRGVIRHHHKYGRPFFCRPGLLEFHEHSQHADEPWDKYREALTLDTLAIELLDGMINRWWGHS